MATRKNYSSSTADVQSTENGFFAHASPLSSVSSFEPPPAESLPKIMWVDVGTLSVDMRYQHPLYDHAVQQLQKDFKSDASGFILINVRADGTLSVIDGMTRVRVRQNLLQTDPSLRWAPAEVRHGMTVKEEAEWYRFKGFNVKRQPTDMFKADCVAEIPDAVQLFKILTKYGLRIQQYAEHKGHRSGSHEVSCVASLRKILQQDRNETSAEILDATFDLIVHTWPNREETPLTKLFIDAIYELLFEYSDKVIRSVFIAKLQGYRVIDLRAAAQQLRLATTPNPTLRKALKVKLVELYNLGQSQEKRIRIDP